MYHGKKRTITGLACDTVTSHLYFVCKFDQIFCCLIHIPNMSFMKSVFVDFN